MTIKDILVHVDSSRAMPNRVAAAAGLARRHDAHLTGLYVIEMPVLPSYAEAQIPAEIIKAQRQAFAARAADSEKQFGEITGSFDVRSEWRCVEERCIDALSLHARYADLVVAGQEDPGDPQCVSRGLAGRLVLESGRPVLVIPTRGEFGVIGENVLVAWNTKREAVRAISDAMPILESANRVSVVIINAKSDDPENSGIPAADIGLHLARHGIKTQAKSLYGAPAAIGELLLAAARDESADLLVMGAYGHARLRETIFGGATAHVLARTDIPTLLAH
ncbi:MAG: universal stress protein [Lysobacterales bacterium]|nr:MAG: universal stress protein [Xanthomonadales bacterium]